MQRAHIWYKNDGGEYVKKIKVNKNNKNII